MTGAEWRYGRHAQDRAEKRGFTTAELIEAAQDWEHELPHKSEPHLRIRGRGRCQVVVDPAAKFILTVLTPGDGVTIRAQSPNAERIYRTVTAAAVQEMASRVGTRIAEPELPEAPKNCTFTWEEPAELSPNPRGAGQGQAEWVAEVVTPRLKHAPGQWACVFTYTAPGSASTKLKKLREAHPELEWIARRSPKTPPEGEQAWSKVYARFPLSAPTE